MSEEPEEQNLQESSTKVSDALSCGVIMPISAIGTYTKDHWIDVLAIAVDVASLQGFKTNLVSAADEVSIIQNTIVNNIYNSDLVICDVSGKNPNVMFELGMRLAFDKPTIIIKDDATEYSFDTSVIEHIEYPRDLRFNRIVAFKKSLGAKIKATYERSLLPDNSSFLKNFGTFNVQNLREQNGGLNEYVINAIEDLRSDISSIKSNRTNKKPTITLSENEIYMIAGKFLDNLAATSNVSRKSLEGTMSLSELVVLFAQFLNGNGHNIPIDSISDAIEAQLRPF